MNRAILALPLLLAACAGPAARSRALAASDPTLLAAVTLPYEDPRTSELSSVAWEPSTRTLFAMSDGAPRIVPLHASRDLKEWSLGTPISLPALSPWDGEGLVALGDHFFVANESGPHLYSFSRAGVLENELPIPAYFASRCRKNRCLESLGATPDGRYLFTSNECALEDDGDLPTLEQGTIVRLLRLDRSTGHSAEFAYRTDPVFTPPGGEMGVVDTLPLSATVVLVMERSYVTDVGTSIRLFRVDVSSAADVSGILPLPASTPVLAKKLVLDLDRVPAARPPLAASSGLGPIPNYEGVTLGPRLPDGSRVLFFISDNNRRATQTARLLVIAVHDLD